MDKGTQAHTHLHLEQINNCNNNKHTNLEGEKVSTPICAFVFFLQWVEHSHLLQAHCFDLPTMMLSSLSFQMRESSTLTSLSCFCHSWLFLFYNHQSNRKRKEDIQQSSMQLRAGHCQPQLWAKHVITGCCLGHLCQMKGAKPTQTA